MGTHEPAERPTELAAQDDGNLEARAAAYEMFILLITLTSLLVVICYYFAPMNLDARLVLYRIEGIYSLILLADFANRFVHAPSKRRYFFTVGWLDLAGSLPGLLVLRFLRLVRIRLQIQRLRLQTPVEAFRSARRQLAQSTLLIVSYVVTVVVAVGSILMVQAEAGTPDANIVTGDDAIWWSLVTVATVGYGDLYPVTYVGRLIGVVMIVMGVSLFTVLTSYIASFFVAKGEDSVVREVQQLRTEIQDLQRTLQQTQAAHGSERCSHESQDDTID
jgi:voltage-gated potassium channel